MTLKRLAKRLVNNVKKSISNKTLEIELSEKARKSFKEKFTGPDTVMYHVARMPFTRPTFKHKPRIVDWYKDAKISGYNTWVGVSTKVHDDGSVTTWIELILLDPQYHEVTHTIDTLKFRDFEDESPVAEHLKLI